MLETIRPDKLESATYKYKFTTREGDVSLYITISELNDVPFEVFINCKHAYYAEHLNVLMVMVSLALRQNIPLLRIAEELGDICSPFTGHFSKQGYVNSLYAGVGRVFKDHLNLQCANTQ